MKTVNIYDYIVIAAYFLFMLGVGIYFMRINKGAKEYFAGGSMIPWWVSGMTLYMANFSAWTFTGVAGFAYSTGLFALLYFSAGPLAYYFGSQLTATRWRRTRSISPVEYTYTRFNITTQQFFGWVIGLNYTLSAGVQLAATCKLLAPVMGLDITMVTIVTGVVILLYTFLGGLWAVSITDVIQGVILLSITFIVMPLSLMMVGGVSNLIAKLPPLSLDHTYNGVHYTIHWVISIFIIMTLGTAGGAAQRFYSVKDERDAKRVGKLAAALFLTGPLVFGIPPLVARVVWPDLSQIAFFKPYAGNNPQDLVFIGLCLKLLPNGLIGVFLAAMLAATMSTLSAVYNLVSSIFSRDMYQGMLRPRTTDEELLTVGRRASVGIGLIVTVLAVIFVNSQFGIFNLMQAFFTLLNIPVIVPLAFGLLFRRVPKWSAVASIIWGLLVGATARYALGWDIGPQVYLSFVMSFGIFAASFHLGVLYKKRKPTLILVSLFIFISLALLFTRTIVNGIEVWNEVVAIAVAFGVGASLYGFAKLFASETDEQRKLVEQFFAKLDTPIDVAREVFGAGKKQISTFPLVGGTTIVMGVLGSLILFTVQGFRETIIMVVMISLMIIFGVFMWYFGKKSEIRNAGQQRQ
ncbi:MAG: sodium/solute symporter, partial [Bacteroidota bacterium]|nr:sodium/solute symporter [Bacteroidota bacterium]